MVACFFEIQIIGDKLQKIKKPVQERQVVLSPAWSPSVNPIFDLAKFI